MVEAKKKNTAIIQNIYFLGLRWDHLFISNEIKINK